MHGSCSMGMSSHAVVVWYLSTEPIANDVRSGLRRVLGRSESHQSCLMCLLETAVL